jgi:hypothetical protein
MTNSVPITTLFAGVNGLIAFTLSQILHFSHLPFARGARER